MGTVHELPEVSGSTDDPLKVCWELVKKWSFIRKGGEVPVERQF